MDVRNYTPVAVMDEVGRIANTRSLWTRFDPAVVPVAIYDGEKTWLFSYPGLPNGFTPLPESKTIGICHGLHDAVRANTAKRIEDVWVACFMSFTHHSSIQEAASIVIHEMFHVFQITYHPDWWANETDRFLYPVFDEESLCLRRLETVMIRRALEPIDDEASLRHVKAALELRNRRYSRIGSKPSDYERGMERIEGLAHYVEILSICGNKVQIPVNEYDPDDVRRRCYAIGAALATLLDRHCLGWGSEFDRFKDVPILDQFLSANIWCNSKEHYSSALIEDDVFQYERTRAKQDISNLHDEYRQMKDNFMLAPGWRLVVESNPNSPLRTFATDPSNLTVLSSVEVLHNRYLTLAQSSKLGTGNIEILGTSALTESNGDHPLYDGIRRLTVAGIREKPTVLYDSGMVQIRGIGVTATFEQATITEQNETLQVIL